MQGEAVVVLDADLQDPPGLIREMIARWQDGAEIVYARACDGGASRFSSGSRGICFIAFSIA